MFSDHLFSTNYSMYTFYYFLLLLNVATGVSHILSIFINLFPRLLSWFTFILHTYIWRMFYFQIVVIYSCSWVVNKSCYSFEKNVVVVAFEVFNNAPKVKVYYYLLLFRSLIFFYRIRSILPYLMILLIHAEYFYLFLHRY